MEDVSNYRAFSLGVVVSDKAFDSDMIIVSPLETLSIQKEGLINPKTDTLPPQYRSSKDTISQDHFELEYWSTNTVEAKWKPIGNTNRKTAPDMVANELVMLYKYGNEDEYYWSEYDDAKEMKKLERVTLRFSNRPGGYFEKATLDDDNSYSVTISTKDKLVHIHTADNDGEVTTWDITINTEAGTLNIVDGLGNKFEWDAGAGTLVENFNTKITRNAPTIEDNCTNHIVNTSNANLNASSTVVSSGTLDISANTTTKGTLTNNGKDISSTHFHPSGPPYTGTPV